MTSMFDASASLLEQLAKLNQEVAEAKASQQGRKEAEKKLAEAEKEAEPFMKKAAPFLRKIEEARTTLSELDKALEATFKARLELASKNETGWKEAIEPKQKKERKPRKYKPCSCGFVPTSPVGKDSLKEHLAANPTHKPAG